MATSENPKLCVTLPIQNAHLPVVNSAFISVASLDFEVFGGCHKAASENPKICATLPFQNAHLPIVNSAFVSVACLPTGRQALILRFSEAANSIS